ncbi:hypothetical protein Q0590_28420 [Rhodocytophaga aerolata]|uniref:DUF885 domain-containing protein n=1 Tax=Rhodocytophaga aerolata TaxID=455078 RepID=A0ABT8RDQ9_9BACT|nr:DUF5700 domain-containing putative Zn-dependent protease [Rhodocytophaga aerolata]MDO1450239.1 hypothetical protein [Rhodocytophaga aerolata]
MKKALIFLGMLTVLQSYGQANTEALQHYFPFVEQLKKDQPLSDSLWQTFLSQAGNRIYIESNNLPQSYLEEYRQKLELVYRPSMDSLLQSKLPTDPMLSAIHRYKTQEPNLKEHMAWLEKTDLLDTMLSHARKFLPKRLQALPFQPQIYYTSLGSEGSASEREVIISLLTSYDLDRIKAGAFGGHEIHHFLRKSKAIKPLADAHKGLYYALDAMLNEGLADLVDKPYFLNEQSDWDQKDIYQSYLLDKAPAVIIALNEIVEKLAQSEESYLDERQYRQLLENSVGHIPGYYMAKTIKDNGLLNRLIEQADNPFTFVALYNKAAKRAGYGAPLFSGQTIVYLRKLEQNYTTK